jgi:hypothetical protein
MRCSPSFSRPSSHGTVRPLQCEKVAAQQNHLKNGLLALASTHERLDRMRLDLEERTAVRVGGWV